ncbi:ABC transporter ATP-binding protein [Aureimonas jatrophae]|uniref:Carbohydrate ABC transporter ATP-binding protein, CUT1 family n=1 Tax=Aureimonas jatrophae TaxID=1166073 RepID=A0A1H0F6J4_9HYPH|nr:sn-glycerol-3-phosphate ABC transporter ATP-binding protein UgpC [Aureimonas jatrophae]MBB3950155.1 multiple sugar transport system ATP-binding protein [Aureimonas jatrophae]SDN90268.1 carbohydrate ABC transporter ATP-binding protein, CUT1 family [Aureimonas jatrophae]
MASIALRDVGKSYGHHPVLHDVNVDIRDGEFVILVGPSGCGKSTLLRMIAGLEEVTDGDIAIGNRVVNDLAPKERDIAMVFQNYALYPHMTVAENMAFSLRLAGAAKAQKDEAVRRAAAILDLETLLDRYPRELSGGQRQRVAMGRAIVRDPAVFLFDEPLSNLDAKLRVQMRTEIKALHQRLKTTMVYVTHDQIEAMTMADRIVVMNGGRVEQVGAPLDLYDRPANLFVAGFIGSPAMNLFAGEVASGDGAPAFRIADGTRLPLPEGAVGLQPGRRVTYGIRPEHMELSDGSGGDAEATVAVVEPTGSETQVFCRLGNADAVGVFRDRVAAQPGDRIALRFRRERILLFDTGTGERIAS